MALEDLDPENTENPFSNGGVLYCLCRTNGLPSRWIQSPETALKGVPLQLAAVPVSHPHQVSTIKGVNPDDTFSLEGIDDGTFAIASSKKELKQLKKSDADVVYYERKGRLYINGNGTKKGWGKGDHDGLVAKFKGKPELSADNFDGLTTHESDAITGGEDIKDQITSLGEELGDEKMSELYRDTVINPKKGLKRIVKAGKKKGYSFDKDELADALNEMYQAGALTSLELDDAAMTSPLGNAGVIAGGGHQVRAVEAN